ncbi:hypothetical protein [Bacillus sp. 7884-1]|uniref:hypothetical protein n=1 Tax=Bacillus sp. 7884-1 TaxID=2021693 RepID=UPI000BA5C16E|nr:hypothetical protein [Bacillus sp. 7884-1]PAE43238.1 hypothetical protein CHI06_07625 [Bacillus sp. 7884-1]
MDFKSESNKELVLDTVNKKIQKIIFDIIFQHLQDMVYVMKVEEGPSFRYLFVNEVGLKKANLPLDVIAVKWSSLRKLIAIKFRYIIFQSLSLQKT